MTRISRVRACQMWFNVGGWRLQSMRRPTIRRDLRMTSFTSTPMNGVKSSEDPGFLRVPYDPKIRQTVGYFFRIKDTLGFDRAYQSSIAMPPKRKSQGRFKDLDNDGDALPQPQVAGHAEQHTTYRHRLELNTVDAESTLYHLPASPVKKARTREEVLREASDPPPLEPIQPEPDDLVWMESDTTETREGSRAAYPSVRSCCTRRLHPT